MSVENFSRLPRHVGIIPDGNRRWARERGLHPTAGYMEGFKKGLEMLDECIDLGIEEVSVYGFTMDNVKRPKDQRDGFSLACVKFAECAVQRRVALKVVGDSESPVFPEPLKPYAKQRIGTGLKINMLVNYGWNWDLEQAFRMRCEEGGKRPISDLLASADVSRIDLVVRWGGMRRLSGFLPVQSVYADFYVAEPYWPDYTSDQFFEALRWYQMQDITLGG